MIDTCPAPPSIPIAIVGVGPTGESVLQRMRAEHLPKVRFLHNDGSLGTELLHQVGLLILVAHLESLADCSAVLALAGRLPSSGFGANTLYVVMHPSAGAREQQKVLAHYSLQTLAVYADATVVLQGDDAEDLSTWLTERVVGLSHAVNHDACSVGIDVHELSSFLYQAGTVVWISAQEEGINRADAVAKALLDQYTLSALPGSTHRQALVSVQGTRQSIKLGEMRVLSNFFSQQLLTSDAHFVLCVSYDDRLGQSIRVSALMCHPYVRAN